MLYQAIMKTLATFGWIAIVGFAASLVCLKIDKHDNKKARSIK